MNEFNLISKYFLPLAKDRPEAGGFQDDAAVLSVPEGQQLVVTTDIVNADIHFPAGAAAGDIAAKALRVNLSDLAAMGAAPYCYQLALALPENTQEDWIAAFTQGLLLEQTTFDIFCSGGDTTRTKGALSIAITAMGLVPAGGAVTREKARPGDAVLLSGPVGDAFIFFGADGVDHTPFEDAYYRPTPRFDLTEALRSHAHAAIDISDGLVADLGHICAASGVGARLELEKIPFSAAAQKLLDKGTVTHEQLLTGGDDYQLLIAAAPGAVDQFPGCQVIGEFVEGVSVQVLNTEGEPMTFKHTGWSHFSCKKP